MREEEDIRLRHDQQGYGEEDVSDTGWQEDPFDTEPAGEETWEDYGETETPTPPGD